MKKSLLALAVLGAFAGVASAQSSVTLYGTLDVNGRYVKNDGTDRRYSLASNGINSSQLGFRGIEDLGAGLKASFVLLAGYNPSDGTTSSGNQLFNRRATASLSGNFGEIRLGRDYVPSYWNVTNFDAFGTNGVGDSSTIKQLQAPDFVRANNTIGYFLPSNIGGLYGQGMVAAAEGTSAGRYIGGRLGFATGPFDVAIAYARERVTAYGSNVVSPLPVNGDQYKTLNVGGSYDFGIAKVLGYYNQEKIGDYKDNIFSVSGVVPLGQGEVHIGGEQSKLTGGTSGDHKSTKYALGYVYNLSKRTALYSNVARVTNGDSPGTIRSNSVVSSYSDSPTGNSTQSGLTDFGGKSTGAEFGIRHFF